MVKLSIIVPVYNVEEFVAECIDSILAQTFNDWELILVNDGSTDRSKQICEKYCELNSRIRLIDKENGGLSSARNAGIEQAQGEFITFIDSDDVIIGKDTLERLMRCFIDDDTLDAVQYDVIFKYLSPEEHRRIYEFKTYTSKEDILRGYLEEQIHVSCCDKVFRTNVFKDIRFPMGQISEDIAVIPQIVENIDKLKTTDIGYYGYRYREGSISKSALPFNKIMSILKSYYTYLNYAMQYESLHPLAVQIYANTIWQYASIVRICYPDKIEDFCQRVGTMHISITDWHKCSKGQSYKRKIYAFVTCVCGTKAVFAFQRFFTK